MRESGILLPIFSLPSAYGIGCFSEEAFRFIEDVRRAGQYAWQILPLGTTGFGDSPYQSFSAYAGNPYFIDPVQLTQEGLLTGEECIEDDCSTEDGRIDYGLLYEKRHHLLHRAFARFRPSAYPDYEKFCAENAYWLPDYCLFMALKGRFNGQSWTYWEAPFRNREPQALALAERELADEIGYHRFLQFVFRQQWDRVHAHARENRVKIIGDIPIYMSMDSADTWADPELFQFDKRGEPMWIAGCPPDGFSDIGQVWGNPLYAWAYHKQTGYAWWIRRIRYCFSLYDVLRVDHFRGFDEYYAIPYGAPTAEGGHWEKGPGLGLFQKIREALGDVAIIAEDLGYVNESVQKLVKDTGYPSMKLIQFAFDSREERNYLPYTYEFNNVVYTGTHDNDTIRGWYAGMRDEDRRWAQRYLELDGKTDEQIVWAFIRMAMESVADLCMIPMQDYLELGSEGRINQPSTLGDNWKWRLHPGEFTNILIDRVFEMTKLYGRV